MKWLTKWFRGEKQPRPAPTKPRRSFQPSFDALDARLVPAVLLEVVSIRKIVGISGQVPVNPPPHSPIISPLAHANVVSGQLGGTFTALRYGPS